MIHADHSEHYSEHSFSEKLKKHLKRIGTELLWKSLTLFILVRQKRLNLRQRTQAIAALGYLILPIDAVPDFTPIIGYSDDLAAVILVLNAIWSSLDADTREVISHEVSHKFRKLIKSAN